AGRSDAGKSGRRRARRRAAISAVAETRQPVAATTPGTSFPVSAQRTKLSRVEISEAARTPAVAPAAVRRAAADRVETSATAPPTIATVPRTRPTRTGSPSSEIAKSAERSGETPTRIAVRDAPTASIARTKSTCERPGATNPATRNGQTPCQVSPPRNGAARTGQTASAPAVVASDTASGSTPGRNEARIATAIAPKRTAEAAASANASTRQRQPCSRIARTSANTDCQQRCQSASERP